MNLNLKTINSLVTLTVSTRQPGWSFRDKAATDAIRQSNGGGDARVLDTVWQKVGPLATASGAITGAAAKLREFGLPQRKGGTYYVQRSAIPAIQKVADDALAVLSAAKAEIVADYGSILASNRARVALSGAEIKWPETGSELAAKFGLEVRWTSAPAEVSDEVLVGLTDEVAARVRAASRAQVEADLKAAHGAPVEELLGQLSDAVRQLAGGKRLRSERFENLRAAADRVRALNWLGLPELTDLADTVSGAVEVAATDAASLAETERATLKGALAQAERAATSALAGLL
jgi:hypothetical protein